MGKGCMIYVQGTRRYIGCNSWSEDGPDRPLLTSLVLGHGHAQSLMVIGNVAILSTPKHTIIIIIIY